MPSLARNGKSAGTTFIDVILVTVFMAITLFVTYSWEHRLSGVFLGFAFFAVGLYFTSASTGILGSILNLKRATWTIGGLVSIPIWLLISLIPSSTTSLEFQTSNALTQLFGQPFFDFITQVIIIPLWETIFLVGFLLGIFIRSKNPSIDKNKFALTKERGAGIISLLVFISGVGAILHYVIALQLAGTGNISFGFIMIHQFLSFYIFAFMMFIGGLPMAIASHMVKNLLLYGTPEFVVGTFAMFIILDIISLKTQPSIAPRFVKQSLKIS